MVYMMKHPKIVEIFVIIINYQGKEKLKLNNKMFHKQKKLTKPIKKVIQYCYTLPTQQNKQYKNLNISIKTKK